MMPARVTWAVAVLAVLPCAGQAQTSSFSGLGFIGGGGVAPISLALGTNADGSVVVGYGRNASEQNEAFRWQNGTMTGLGFLGGVANPNPNSAAYAVSADGSVIVGVSSNAAGQVQEAFRWQGGTMTGLGFIGGGGPSPNSFAYATNADGSVVVGFSSNATGRTEAFRWQGGTMAGLGFIGGGGPNPQSSAQATNADGSVVVGSSSNPAGQTEAFRWQGGTMSGLGFIGGGGSSPFSEARGTNADGSVVVGFSSNAAGQPEAFRWQGGTMAGLGFIGGASNPNPGSQANATDASGSVVVGVASNPAGQFEAFRWTQATQIKSLSGLLTTAGVNLGSWQLVSAYGVSGNGQFIVGEGIDPNGRTQAWLVRYVDAAPPTTPGTPTTPETTTTPGATTAPIIAGMTTAASVQHSLDQLAQARRALAVHQHAFAAQLLGNSQPIGSGTEVGTFASAGSFQAGGHGRIAYGNGLTLLGGISYQESDVRHAEITSAATGALALRYVFGSLGSVSPYIEAGGWLTPDGDMRFERSYANGVGTAKGIGKTSGTLSYVYGRAGLALQASPGNEFAVAAEIGRETLRIKHYAEPLLGSNPFEASLASGTDSLNIVKARVQWTHAFSDRLDGTIYGAGAYGFDEQIKVVATVAGFGSMIGAEPKRASWVEYGARLGYRLTQNLKLDVFVDGLSGRSEIGTRLHAGAGVRWLF